MDAPVEWPAANRLSRAAERAPDRPALVDAATGEAWSHAALSSGPVETVAAGLRDAGVGPGDHLGALREPGPRVAVLLHATARVGATFVPLAPDAPEDAVAARCAAADVTHLVADGATVDAAASAFDGPTLDLETLGPLDAEGPASGASHEPAVAPHRWSPDDVEWLVFTSGTTGEPTPVALTAGNLAASAAASARRLGVEADDRWLACLPTHHVGGLAPFVRAAHQGTTAVAQAGFDAAATAEAIAAHGVTGVSLVPTMLARLLDDGWRPPALMRFVLLGGAPTPPALVDRCEAAGVPVHPTYGMTETASQVATALPAEAFAHRGTVGRPLDSTTVRVVDASGAPVPAGEPGAIVVAGPTVAAGYHGDEAATAERFRDDGFHTRDRGRLDKAGRLWVLDRLDDAIQTGGETVHPDRVVAALREHPAVEDAAVVGLPDPEWGEAVAALVVVGPGGSARGTGDADVVSEALREHCRERLAPHAVPKVLAVADGLPRTASGTVDRAAVRDRLRRQGTPTGL